MKRVRRLYARIYLHVLLVLFVVGFAITGVLSIGQRGALLREVTERLSRHFASELGERFTDSAARTSALERLHRDFELDLSVRAPNGQLLAAAGAPLPALSPAELASVRSGRDISQRRSIVAAAPIRDAQTGAVVGILQMSATQKLRAISWGNLVRPLGAVALVLFLVAIASFPLSRRISRPIEQLTAASRRLGAGELGYRIPLPDWCAQPGPATLGRRQRPRHRHPRDELHELLHTWNDMADRIERLVHGQRELLANISHELRSPLTRVRVALALLPLEGEGENRLREVEADLGELERLIEDVLMTSRLQAIGLPTRPSAVDLRPLLSQVSARASHDPLCSGHSVAVAEGPDLTLHADGTLLKRALFNLVQNGAKYGASPIVISAVTVGDNVEISVSDEGDGIPPEELARVLEPFYRIDKARTPSSSPSLPSVSHGFGLGLTLAKQVALAHGGTITISPLRDEAAVRAGLGKRGCKVTLSLPVGG